MKGRTYSFIAVVVFSLLFVRLIRAEESCEEIGNYVYHHNNDFYYLWHVWYYNERYWHNMSFWGGHVQIPQKDTMGSECTTTWGNAVVLTDKHPDLATLGENIVSVQACSLNQNGVCSWDMDVQMRKCHGDLLYSFPWLDIANEETWNHYICFDRIYADHADTCDDTSSVYSAGNESGKFIHFSEGDIQAGWYDAFHGWKQFVPPSLEDLDEIVDECSSNNWLFILQEHLPQVTEETPTRLVLCYVYRYDNADYSDYVYCDHFIYVRACNGKLQFDISFFRHWYHDVLCLIHHNNVKVQPEIDHDVHSITVDGRTVRTYDPFLQYRCSFDKVDAALDEANWYINGTLQIQMGSPEDFVFKEEYLKHLKPGYEVQCGIITTYGNESIELLSDVFYAGWKISDNSISLSKSGYTMVEIEQTIPLGCNYTDDTTPTCIEELTFVDPSYVPGVCAGGIRVQNADDASKSFIEVKSLKKGEEWTNKKYRAKLSTHDSNYDDNTHFDLQLSVTHFAGHLSRRSVSTEIVGAVHVDITDVNRHWNKRCYSHVDPHMKTVDGLYYEAQEEGDYMLAWNKEFQTEIQTSARYCSRRYPGGPVCACGIAIAVGADAFIIDKCQENDFKFDYVQCGDGGIIDVEEVRPPYQYTVRTPIGTSIDIFLNTWGDTMNIDVYMSAKDFGNVVGLCGYFDGNRDNDLLHRDNTTISYDNNRSYKFADSWRLTDEENLFLHNKRYLKQWNVNNGEPDQPCSRPYSITRNKCSFNRRTRRATSGRLRREMRKQVLLSRNKRSTGNFTEEEAYMLCNHSIYTTPAVQTFPDKLGEEDPDEVVDQCVYDVTQGNDTAWVEAHTTALNNAVDTILKLNPVYVANNTDIVNTFRLQTCLNNCSGNGMCTETGLCDCNHGSFRGADCSIDIRIPPIVYYIEGDGICEETAGDDCTCFQIRTNNIFDGFMCDISKYKVYFNGTGILEVNSKHVGNYADIFTGECCDPVVRKKRSNAYQLDVTEPSVIMYEFSISNDEVNYGETNTVFVYDTTCLLHVDINGTVTFELKTGYCFIEGTCVAHDFNVLNTDECLLCDPTTDRYNWTKGNCDKSTTGLTTGALIGIVIGSLVVATVTAVLVYLLCCNGSKKHRTVKDVQSNLQTKLARINLPIPTKHGEKCSVMKQDKTANGPDTVTVVPRINTFDSAKPVWSRNMWTDTLSTPKPHNDNTLPTVERTCSSIEVDVLEY